MLAIWICQREVIKYFKWKAESLDLIRKGKIVYWSCKIYSKLNLSMKKKKEIYASIVIALHTTKVRATLGKCLFKMEKAFN